MWRSKKFIIAVMLAAVVLLGSIGGVVFAQTENESDSQPVALWDRVAAILQDEGVTVTSDQLKDAFVQAQGQLQAEALENHLAKLVEDGVIDETQAGEILEWWNSRPDDLPFGFGFGGGGGFRGMGGMRGFGGPCAPVE